MTIEGDCLEVLPGMARGNVDLLLTDPPYAMPAQYYAGRESASMRRWSDSSIMMGWWRLFIDRAMPVMKPDSTVAVFANANAISVFWPIMFEVTRALQLVVWDKGRIGMGAPFRNQAEYVIIGLIGSPFRRDAGIGNVLRHSPVHHSRRAHPAQKPESLLSELILQLCPDGGHVLDPFSGSGSTARACATLGRDIRSTSVEWGTGTADTVIPPDLFVAADG